MAFEVDASGVKPGLDGIKRDVRDMAQDVQQSGQQAAKGLAAIGDGAPAASQKVDGAARSIIGSIERATAAMKAGEKGSASYYETLGQQRGVSADVLKPYIDQLRQAERAQQAASGSLNTMGVSAKQTAAALRGVPAQFTDIITSLQGGQAPLTVLLQQGGQLKDMFGGAGNAARALGGYVLGLVNPFTVAAAAVAGLGFAMFRAEDSLRSSNSIAIQLQATGRSADLTRDQIKALKQELTFLPDVSKAAASAIINEFVKTREVGGKLFRDLALSVADFAVATGTDAPTAAKTLAQAFNDPAKGAKQLDEALNVLTASQYLAVDAMLAVGDKAGAQAVLFDALKASTQGLAQDSLTPLEKAINGLGDTWTLTISRINDAGGLKAANEMFAGLIMKVSNLVEWLGRARLPPWLEDQFKGGLNGAVYRTFASAPASSVNTGGAEGSWAPSTGGATGSWGAPVSTLDEEAKSALEATKSYKSVASSMAEVREQGDRLRTVLTKLKEAGKGTSSEAQELQSRLDGVKERLDALSKKASAGQMVGQSELAGIRAKIKDEESYIARLKERGTAADKLTEGERLAAKIQEELNGKLDVRTRAVKQLELVEANRLAVVQKVRIEAEKSVKSQADSEAGFQKFLESIYKGAEATNKQAEAQEAANASFGKSKIAIAEMNLAQMELARSMEQDAGPWTAEHLAAMDAAIDAQKRWVASLQQGDLKTINAHTGEILRNAQEQAKLYEDEAQLVGLTALEREKIVALRLVELKYAKELDKINKSTLSDDEKQAQRAKLEQAKRIEGEAAVSKVIRDDWTKTTDEINRSLTDALLRGFESGKGFAENLRDTLKNMFNTLVLRPIISAVLAPVSGVVSGLTNGLTGGGGSAVGTVSNGYSLYNTGSQLYNIGSQYIGGTMSGANALGTVWGNATGTGIDGLLATNGAYGTAGGAGAVPWGAGGSFVAVAALVLNALGAFRSDKQVGGGLRGTLGAGDIESYQLWREGGTLFGGPDYRLRNPAQERDLLQSELKKLRDQGQGATGQAVEYQQRIDEIDRLYGEQITAQKAQSDTLQKTFDAMRSSVGDMADALGISSDAVRKFTVTLGSDVLHPDTGGVGLKFDGLNAEQISAKIQTALETANNELAQQVIGSWKTVTETVTRTNTVRAPITGDNEIAGEWQEVTDTITRTVYVASEYARENEKAIDTLTRLAGSITTVNGIFEMLGVSLYDASLAGADMASKLIDSFGGADKMREATGTYFQNFYSKEEQRAAMQRQLQSQADAIDIKLPDIDATDARAQYRALIDAQDLNTDAGRKAYAVLVQLAGAFAGVTAAADDGVRAAQEAAQRQQSIADKGRDLEQRLLIAQGKDRQALDLRRLQEYYALLDLNPALAAMVIEIYKAEDAAQALVKAQEARETAYSRLRDAATLESERINAQIENIDAQRTATNLQRDIANESLSLITGVFELVRGQAQDLYGQVESTAKLQAAQGFAFIDQALANAKSTGYLPEQAPLQEAITAARGGLDSQSYSTQFEKDRDALVLAGKLSQLEAISGKQKTLAEQQVEAMDNQLAALDAQTKTLNDQLRAQDKVLEYWRRQIDIANGTFDATLTVAQAVDRVALALGAKTAGVNTKAPTEVNSGGAVWGGSGSTAPAATAKYSRVMSAGTAGVGYEPIIDQALIAQLDVLAPLYHSYDGSGDLTGLLTAFKGAGATMDDLSILSGFFLSDWIKAGATVGIPAFAVGTNYVQRDMLAQIHEGEAIVPKAFNPWASGTAWGSGFATAELVAEVRALREENRTQAGALLRLNARVAKVLDRWDGDGLPAEREEATA